MSKPAVVFRSRAAHVNRARALLRPRPRPRPLACAEPYNLRVSDASYNDVGTIERDRALMGISHKSLDFSVTLPRGTDNHG